MSADERDRSFDKALARHLRSAAPADEAVGTPAVPGLQAGVCPDSETLAAYHERSLFPAQLNALKEHIVGCAHCQAILSQLEATDEISLQAPDRQEAVAKRPEPVMAARNLEAACTAAVAPRKKSRRVLLMRGARWRWLAPAGAIAASLLVWIALHENRPLAPPDLKQVQVAKNQAPPSPAPSISTVPQAVSPSAKAAAKKPQSAADEFARAEARGVLDAAKSRGKQDYLAQASPPKPLADKEYALRKDAEGPSAPEVSSAHEQMDRDAKTVSGGRQENAEVQIQAQAANVQSQNQVNSNAPPIGGPAPLGQADSRKREFKAARASAVPTPPAKPSAGLSGASSMMEVVTVSNPRLISPPGSNVIWRAGRSGLIELSRDGGSSWSRQTSGVLADLLTGSAPSDQVCWIVGRAGAILLTTDGGAHWQLIHSPLTEDLGGIRAMDSLHATIWNTRNTRSFETSDGGLTWTPVPSP